MDPSRSMTVARRGVTLSGLGAGLLCGLGLAVTGVACGTPPPPPPLRTGPTQVVWWTSPDAVTWTRQPGVLAEHFVSLGLSVRPDGALWVTGIDQSGGGSPGWWERLRGPSAGGLVFDGTAWTRETFRVRGADAPALLDPQWSGDELFFAAREGRGGDPAEAGMVRIRSAPPGRTLLEGVGITDPSAVTFGGQQHLFVSVLGRGVVHHAGDPLQEVQAWGRVQVPQAVVVEDQLWVVAQARIRARRQPVLARSLDGRTFSSWEPVLPEGQIEHCTSPVLGPSPAGGFVLLCVAEQPPPSPGGAP